MNKNYSLERLKSFLVAAKCNTYASLGDNATVTPLLPGAKQLEYREGLWFYRDIYVGLYRFVGQEIVYLSGYAVWSMSYAGGLSGDVPAPLADSVYGFLRQALRQVHRELPVRGPARLEEGELAYTCQSVGTVQAFYGVESIVQNDQSLYELHFSGGVLA